MLRFMVCAAAVLGALSAPATAAATEINMVPLNFTVAPVAAPVNNAQSVTVTGQLDSVVSCPVEQDCRFRFAVRMLPVTAQCRDSGAVAPVWASAEFADTDAGVPVSLPVSWQAPKAVFGTQQKVCLSVHLVDAWATPRELLITVPARKIVLTQQIAYKVARRYAANHRLSSPTVGCNKRAEEVFRCSIAYTRSDGKRTRRRVMITHEGTKFVVRRIR